MFAVQQDSLRYFAETQATRIKDLPQRRSTVGPRDVIRTSAKDLWFPKNIRYYTVLSYLPTYLHTIHSHSHSHSYVHVH